MPIHFGRCPKIPSDEPHWTCSSSRYISYVSLVAAHSQAQQWHSHDSALFYVSRALDGSSTVPSISSVRAVFRWSISCGLTLATICRFTHLSQMGNVWSHRTFARRQGSHETGFLLRLNITAGVDTSWGVSSPVISAGMHGILQHQSGLRIFETRMGLRIKSQPNPEGGVSGNFILFLNSEAGCSKVITKTIVYLLMN